MRMFFMGLALLSASSMAKPAVEHEVFWSLSAGATWASITHPSFKAQFFTPTYSIGAGVGLNDFVSLGANFEVLTRYANRVAEHTYALASPGPCDSCFVSPGSSSRVGAWLGFDAVNARVDLHPWGAIGPYASALAGVAFVQGFAPEDVQDVTAGTSFGARVGFRYRLVPVVELAGEAGWQAHWYGRATVHQASLSALVRLYF